MVKKRVVLTFPPELAELPITYHLVKDFDLSLNILKAKIVPGEEGKLVLELANGEEEKIMAGIEFIRSQGVLVEPVSKEITLNEEECIHCGACTAVCTPRALFLDPASAELRFDREQCIVCELCVKACPMRVIKVTF
ncbi:MAG: 4Fe-4S binding protein [Firmicutes bacterium]|nr:4Fe-4S binding protein [Bacillota bacterium]